MCLLSIVRNKNDAAWLHQAITWTNFDLSSGRPSVMELRAISHEIPYILVNNEDILLPPRGMWQIHAILTTCDYTWLEQRYKNTIPVKLPWIFPGAPLKVNEAPGNIQGNLTGTKHLHQNVYMQSSYCL